jgi:ubiquitin conjugation factor E4 B
MNNLYDGLAEVLLTLLKNPDTRENVLEYLAEVINKNSSRAHIQVFISFDQSCRKSFSSGN